MKFQTTRFGEIEVKKEDILIIPHGPLGFYDCIRWTFLDEKKATPFRMLQSLDQPTIAFVMIDPLYVRSDYHFEVELEELKLVKAQNTNQTTIYCMVTMNKNIQEVSVNLQGPFIFNMEEKLGFQHVLVNSIYTTRESILLDTNEKGD